MSKIVILGATGSTGSLLVRQGQAAGHQVRVGVRRPTDYHAPSPEIEVRQVDVTDAVSLRAAITGQDAVLSAIGPARAKANALCSTFARCLVRVAGENGALRVIVMSSAGVRRKDPAFPLWYRLVSRTLLRELYGDMARMEGILAETGLRWTAVRPTRISDDPPNGRYRVLDGATPPRARSIPGEDLAEFMINCVDGDDWIRKAPTVAR